MVEALLYRREEKKIVRCFLCAHRCLLREEQTGICRVRKNIGGILYSLNSDRVAAVHLDPIEKKPLYHFFPASTSLSIAATGCNFSCHFCQNHELSQVVDETRICGEKISPAGLVEMAIRSRALSISYTYTEPTVFFELMFETARLAKQANLRNVMVTNGYMGREALEMISPYLDAANVDLKSFSDDFYRTHCGGELYPVLETIREMKRRGIWIEVTTLLIPGLNEERDEQNKLISFLLELDPCLPWHVSRFFPQYRLTDRPVTPAGDIFSLLDLAVKKGLRFVYGGNLDDERGSDTFCTECRLRLIRRHGYQAEVLGMAGGACLRCGKPVPGVWQ